MPQNYSPAALVLMRRGVRLADIGERLGGGLTSATVSRQLSGELSPHPHLIDAVRLVAGPDAAAEIAGHIGLSP